MLTVQLNGSVTDDNGKEYTRPDDVRRPGSDLPTPKCVLDNLLWSFPDDVPTDRAGFDAVVWARQYASGNDFCWEPDEVILSVGRVRVAGDDAVELASENGMSFTAGELLWKVHRAFVEQLAGSNHRFLEGLWLHPPSLVNGPPLYHLRLGS